MSQKIMKIMFLVANFFKDSHIYARILFIFIKNVLKQTSSSFNT